MKIMNEKKARLYTVLIKATIAIVAGLFLILFIFQYTKMIGLQNKNDNLSSELSTLQNKQQAVNDQIDKFADKDNQEEPSDEYTIDTAHGNGYVKDGEILIDAN